MKIDKRRKSRSAARTGGMVAATGAGTSRSPVGKGLMAILAIVAVAMLAKAVLSRRPAH